MKYYDIHTHQLPQHPEDTVIFNTIIGHSGNKYTGLRSAGIHPLHIAEEREKQLKELEREALLREVVAIGECGLDKRGKTTMAIQQELFIDQLILAHKVQKPVIIHCVKAWAELLEAEKEALPDQKRIIHGFRGNGKLAEQLLKHGHALSFGCYFNPEAVHAAWPHRIFAETDERCADIRRVYSALSEALSIPLEIVSQQLANNMAACFYEGI